LLPDNDLLWIETRRNVQCYNIYISDRTLCILLAERYELITSCDELEHLNPQHLTKHACLEENFILLMIMETHL